MKLEPSNTNILSHLRQSITSFGIKQYGLRKVQYLLGFKTLMSVERYRNGTLENLKSAIKKNHPMDGQNNADS